MRTFRKLRLQLTANCNYRCTYCDIGNGTSPMVQSEQLVHYLQCLRESGIDQLRLTGGEPLLYSDLKNLLRQLPRMGFASVGITTNGQMLQHFVLDLYNAGVRTVNVSLDSLDKECFHKVTRGGRLDLVLQGITSAKKAGMQVKLNAVAMQSLQPEITIPKLLDYAMSEDIELRFLELMQMGTMYEKKQWEQEYVSMQTILAIAQDHYQSNYQVQSMPKAAHSTAQHFQIQHLAKPEVLGTFGIIANTSAPFCHDCNRLRLTEKGHLYGCLGSDKYIDISGVLDMPAAQAVKKLKSEWLPSALGEKRDYFAGERISMREIGG